MKIGPPRDEVEELFDELGEFHEHRAGVQKKVFAHDIKEAMKAKKVSPSEMARRMRTSREAVYRLLDPTRTGVTLDSLQRAASALGLTLNIISASNRRLDDQQQDPKAWPCGGRSGPPDDCLGSDRRLGHSP
jgi:DNA-binding phage protein